MIKSSAVPSGGLDAAGVFLGQMTLMWIVRGAPLWIYEVGNGLLLLDTHMEFGG